MAGHCPLPEEAWPSRRTRTERRRFLRHLQQKWKLLGLFEIGPDHELYGLTCMMKQGLRDALQVSVDLPPPKPPSGADFTDVLTQPHQGFELRTFSGSAFFYLRHSLGLAEKDYQHSLTSGACYLQFISNSKSKASFFLSNDKRFFLKTQDRREARFLLRLLPRYLQHLHRYPHSLLVKFLGVHSLQVAQGKKQYFIIMQSIFYPDERISDRYDIKGCQVNRWTEPVPEGSPVIVVLKDLNFEGNVLRLGSQRAWLLRQMELDTAFLKELNVLDYSLLLATQLLHEDEKGGGGHLILRTARSIQGAGSPQTSEPGTPTEEEADGLVVEMPGGLQLSAGPSSPDLLAQNRRLLPDVRNALHVLDGPDHRYFVGLIDLFTVYSFRKRLEHLWKCLRYPGQTFSTVSPGRYARRLCRWVETHSV
ncbi:phosphatidylinositol 4-phosphate 5-kinase-like protein 1 [Tachyglossus aculeatus]|uniref:phosphatidylinositol 4-phosphate 5-kinase-like protein 1 n=1 Tax=Tachyglossus aculeatus TaxID=9261 RepID=UPI0018F5647F|nr:phosphatidylinositol 4-phosphate 5-kinase-like protein 1 [Tachyglossus aculeatus]